jgi:hypothetical protein
VAWSVTFLLPNPLNAAEVPATPIQAELLQRLDAQKILPGASVLARVQLGWRGSSCNLRPGDILQGRIVFQKPYSKVDKTSEIAIVFDKAQCGGPALKPFPLTLAAIVAADRQRDPALQPSEEHQSLSDAVGLTLNGNTRSVSQAANTVGYEPGRTVYVSPRRAAPPKELRAGQVVGIAHLKLLFGKGPEGGSILRSRGRVLRLDAGTQFVLFPSVAADAAVPRKDANGTFASNQHAEVQASLAAPPDIADETEVCAPPSCYVGFGDNASGAETHDAELTLPLNTFGYLPPSAERELFAFDYHAGVAFLGQGQLLFTFNPHMLVKRTPSEAITSSGLRIIRAIAVDLATKKVVKSVDWRVADSGQYFWTVGDEQVLVHVGDELRVYGPGLELRKKISLSAPLAFIRQSPSSAFLAVGVVNERHTPEIHRQLQEADGREPEEDIEVRVLDSAFHPITKIMRSSRQAFPVLLDDGEVRVLKIGADRWRIVKNSWAGERRVLAQASSSCLPTAQSLPGDLLFVVGCDHRRDNKWYRILRGDQVLLKGSSSSAEFEHTVSGIHGGNIFVIGIAQANQSLPWGGVFHVSDLKSERIVLYSARTGHRILGLNVSPVVPAVQTFAISPREDKLAVLTTDQITLYRIPRILDHELSKTDSPSSQLRKSRM